MTTIFEEVAQWDRGCPHLLKDKLGQKTLTIQLGHPTLSQQRNAMLMQYLQEATPPTWDDIITALDMGTYRNLADRIKKDLQG